jgi:hypothetical protein
MDQWQNFERVVADEMTSTSHRVADITPPGWGTDDEISAHDDRPPLRGRRLWRRVAEPIVLLAAAATFFGVMKFTEKRDAPASDEASAPVAASSAGPATGRSGPLVDAHRPDVESPRLVVPETARRGEQIRILGYRDAGLCGPTALRFDGVPIAHQVQASMMPKAGDWVDLYLTVTIPSVASVGSHSLELFGPVEGGNAGVLCGDEPEREDLLADADIIVFP